MWYIQSKKYNMSMLQERVGVNFRHTLNCLLHLLLTSCVTVEIYLNSQSQRHCKIGVRIHRMTDT